jgi:hypothetical protein
MNTNTVTAAIVEDIRDIRPPIHIPYGWLWAAYLAGAVALAGLIYAAWRWRRDRGLRRKLPHEIALEQLEAARALMIPDEAYTFSIKVSEIVRIYIEERFHARAAHHTTEEFLHDVLTGEYLSLEEYRPALADFLEHCDLAKFARWQLSLPEMEAMHLSACAFVAETGKPMPELQLTR